MTEEEYKLWLPLVERASRTIVGDFPDSEYDDLVQATWEGLLEAQSKGKLLDPEHEFALSALRYIAKAAAWGERKEHLTRSAQYSYRTKDVRNLFKTFFGSRADWTHAIVPQDAESEFNVGMEMSSDLSRAWDKLPHHYKVYIFSEFALGEPQDSKRLSRALARAADILNTYQPKSKIGPTTGGRNGRRVITNANARYLIGHQDGTVDQSGQQNL